VLSRERWEPGERQQELLVEGVRVRRGFAGARVLLEIQLAASQLAQEQVVPQAHYTNISPRYCSR